MGLILLILGGVVVITFVVAWAIGSASARNRSDSGSHGEYTIDEMMFYDDMSDDED